MTLGENRLVLCNRLSSSFCRQLLLVVEVKAGDDACFLFPERLITCVMRLPTKSVAICIKGEGKFSRTDSNLCHWNSSIMVAVHNKKRKCWFMFWLFRQFFICLVLFSLILSLFVPFSTTHAAGAAVRIGVTESK